MEVILSGKTKALKAGDHQPLGGGLVFNPTERSIAISPKHLEPATNFFCADHYKMKVSGSNLEIMFGQVNSFSEEEELTLVIQVAFPIQMAIASFHDMVWIHPGSSGLAPFSDTLKKVVEESASLFGENIRNTIYDNFKLPSQKETRKFAANFATCAYSSGEAIIDFYQASPQLIHYALNHNSIRPNEKIQNIFAVVMSLNLLFEFLVKCKSLLEPFTVKTKGN